MDCSVWKRQNRSDHALDSKAKNCKEKIILFAFKNVNFYLKQIGLVKSPVEGSTAALVRLQSPVVYSDFVRPICLPDDDFAKNSIITDYPVNSALSSANLIESKPRAEKFFVRKQKRLPSFAEDTQFFQITDKEEMEEDEESQQNLYTELTASGLVDEHLNSLRPEAQHQPRSAYYPNNHHDNAANDNQVNEDPPHQWLQCNTLGWSRQREHLQRVQLKMNDMKACENISITTVNSLCAEAAYHKQDCNVSFGVFFKFLKFNIIFTGGRVCRKSNDVPIVG
jgi:hypothetical protein